MKCILVTGGAGFIGSHFVRYMLETYPQYRVHVLDKLTYAGNLTNLVDVQERYSAASRYKFFRGDICDAQMVASAMKGCQYVVNFAAETHVDRSIDNPGQFVTTDTYGTYILLEQARKEGVERFVQISTDEVYGDIPVGSCNEQHTIAPRSPYSASKAAGELLAHAYFTTYDVPVVITRGSNTYGPFQYPEKLIPLFVTNAIDDKTLPLYGDGQQVRDWLHVLDHCKGIDMVLQNGEAGEVYNIGAENAYQNITIAHLILNALQKPFSLLQHVQDRPGHDRRYSMDSTKIKKLGWRPEHAFEESIALVVRWYVEHEAWWRPLQKTSQVPSFLRHGGL